MGTLGKILLVVNLLAAAGLVYVVSLDVAARRNIQLNAVRHQLLLSGVPVQAPAGVVAGSDEVALDLATTGLYRVPTVPKKVFSEAFQGAGGDEVGTSNAPTTQLEEVKAAKNALDAKITGGVPDQLALLCGKVTSVNNALVFSPGYLAKLAQSYAERTAVRRLADAEVIQRNPAQAEANLATAKALWDRHFDAVQKVDASTADSEAAKLKDLRDAVNKAADAAQAKFATYQAAISAPTPDDAATVAAAKESDAALQEVNRAQKALEDATLSLGQTASRDESDRRRRIAHLLMHLGESTTWQKRVAFVVGLKTYHQALSDQATRLQRMALSAEQQITLDQGRFTDEYGILKQQALAFSTLLRQQTESRQGFEAERAKDDEAATSRRTILAARRAELESLRQAVTQSLATQAEAEARLFGRQKAVGELLQGVFDLEDKLAAAERAGR